MDTNSETSLPIEDDNFDPITISWSSINVYSRNHPKASKLRIPHLSADICKGFRFKRRTYEQVPSSTHILKNVYGVCRPGELLAIMGLSGAGKTTLLNVLTQRNNDHLKVTGDLFVNGIRVKPDDLSNRSAYVQQDDMFISTLTVREQLVFQAMLRMPRHLTKEERLERVNTVISELGLVSCEHTLIGGAREGKGISGGERRRLNFACEVLTNASLMFCDEPTSGLDSFMAQNVVTVMKSMAERGKTIISTIHQPSSEVYAMFDRLMLMADGRVAFLGNTDKALQFFTNVGLPCPRQFNPADHFLDQLSISPGETQAKLDKKRISFLCDEFQTSQMGQLLAKDITTNQKPPVLHRYRNGKRHGGGDGDVNDGGGNSGGYRSRWAWQMQWLTWRSGLQVIRDPRLIKVNLIQSLATAAVIVLMYGWQAKNQQGVVNVSGMLMLFSFNLAYQNINAIVQTFSPERELFFRDHENWMYRPSCYFVAHSLIKAPVVALNAILYILPIYFAADFNLDFTRLAMCLLITILLVWCGISFGYLLSSLAPNLNSALSMVGPPITFFYLLSGYPLNVRSLASTFKVLQHMSWLWYGMEAMMVNQWVGVHNITCTHNHSCYSNGHAVLSRFGYSEQSLTSDILSLLLLGLFYKAVAFGIFLLRAHKRQIRSVYGN